nr:LysR family transcriptional regulator [Agromyces seonyuensis]
MLVSLDALLSECSVTRAAQRLHLSQPALSASLSRLRTHFGDPLLARRGNSYELTPLAIRLSEHTTTALEAARRVFESEATWDPSRSTREFSVYGSDYAFATIGTRVSGLARVRAPGVRFRFMLHNPTVVADAAGRLRSADAMLIPHGFLTELPYDDLWQDDWVLIADPDHPDLADGVTMEHLGRLPWVFTYQSREAFTSANRQLQQLGLEPHVDAVVESFLAIGHFITGSERLALVQAAVAPAIQRAAGVAVHRVPFDATPIHNALWWNPVHNRDPEHLWMRELFQDAAADLADSAPPSRS